MEVLTDEGAKPTESWEELSSHARGLRQDLAEVAEGQCAQRVAWRGCREGDEGEKCRDLAPCFPTVWIDLRCRGNHWPPSSRGDAGADSGFTPSPWLPGDNLHSRVPSE